MKPVVLYVFRCAGYFGIGLAPEAAVTLAVSAGLKRKEVKHGLMTRYPTGTTHIGVNGVGDVEWSNPDKEARSVRLQWNFKNKSFEDPEDEAPTKTQTNPSFEDGV